ncbi:MAG: hypothetical protein ACE5DR_04260, partial [Thermodesulfobacteriota bacterium]
MRRYLREGVKGPVLLTGLLFILTTIITVGTASGAIFGERENEGIDLDSPYAIHLYSTIKPVDTATLPPASLFKGYRLYTTERTVRGRLWHRLRLGFFPTKEAAGLKLKELEDKFPRASVIRVSKRERELSADLAVPLKKGKGLRRPVSRAKKEPQAETKQAQEKGLYAVTLYISTKSIKAERIPDLEIFEKYNLYTVDYSGKDKRWHILRMGFFSSESDALKVKDDLGRTFPQAMVTSVEPAEKKKSAKYIIKPRGSSAKSAPLGRKKIKLSRRVEKRIKGLLKDAKLAMTRGDNKEAAALLGKILKYPENDYSPEALELLGLAYERENRSSRAKSTYREYLLIYPEGEGAARVNQRLAGLTTARDIPKKSYKPKARTRDIKEFYGSFSQFYNRDSSYTDVGGSTLNRSSLSTDMDLTYRSRTADYEIRSVFIGGYEHDFLGDSEGRINRLYLDVLNRNNNVSGRVGRQWYSTGGVLGRFDGALLSFGKIPRVKINLVAGFPAESSTLSSVNTDKSILGVNLDLGTFWKRWDFNVYGINQRVDSVTDRRAVGGEARYNDSRGSYFTTLDYDVLF